MLFETLAALHPALLSKDLFTDAILGRIKKL
jgi:hypothetical protein